LQKELAIKYPDSVTYEKSYEYGQALGRKLDTALVYCCDIYFKLTDSLRFSGFNSMNKDSLKTELQKLNGPGLPKAEKVLEKKAALNFILGNYKDANTYAEEVLNYKPDHLYALVYKSYFLELEKKYDEALVLYSNLAKMTGQGNYLVWVAIVSRKKRELKSQP
jgi:tetratricopeptide (TPR) repeat protein